mgnify:CR=1 FL=1
MKWPEGYPHVCPNCLKQLSPGDKAAIIVSLENTELLRDIRGQLEILTRNTEADEQERASHAKALENIGRQLKLPAGKVTELVNQFQPVARLLFEMLSAAAKRDERDGDDDEPWRESMKE